MTLVAGKSSVIDSYSIVNEIAHGQVTVIVILLTIPYWELLSLPLMLP
jgi:hypothetical protein